MARPCLMPITGVSTSPLFCLASANPSREQEGRAALALRLHIRNNITVQLAMLVPHRVTTVKNREAK